MRKLLVLLLISLPVMAQEDAASVIQRADEAYRQGDFETTIQLYEALVDDGFHDVPVFYNLGNAYYHSGQLGMALLNYRRARLLDPRDSEITNSIRRIRAERVDFQGDDSALIDRLASSTESLLTLSELSWLVTLIWITWFSLLTIWITWISRRNKLLLPLFVLGLCLLFGLIPLLTRVYAENHRPSAVAIALTAPVMSGPGEDYLNLFQIHAAAELRLLESRGDWARFILPDSRQGWIHQDMVEMVQLPG
jgi:tetratricopeptide (TPR) repeat protein